jgi:hypothetical protein
LFQQRKISVQTSNQKQKISSSTSAASDGSTTTTMEEEEVSLKMVLPKVMNPFKLEEAGEEEEEKARRAPIARMESALDRITDEEVWFVFVSIFVFHFSLRVFARKILLKYQCSLMFLFHLV